MDLAAVKQEFQGAVFHEQTFTTNAQDLSDYAAACGETAAQYVDPQHADFQASPTFASSLQVKQRFPEGFPKFSGLGMDGGKAVTNHQPIRAGVELTGRCLIHDVYSKSGRSGNMTFIILHLEVYDPADVHLATAATSVVIRERPAKQGDAK